MFFLGDAEIIRVKRAGLSNALGLPTPMFEDAAAPSPAAAPSWEEETPIVESIPLALTTRVAQLPSGLAAPVVPRGESNQKRQRLAFEYSPVDHLRDITTSCGAKALIEACF